MSARAAHPTTRRDGDATRPAAPLATLAPSLRLLIAPRALMELGVVLALAAWGLHAGGTLAARVGLAVLAPVLGFGFWGTVDFRWAGRLAEPLRLIQELAITGLAAAALGDAGHPTWGWALAAGSVAYHALVYGLGQRLLQPGGGHR